MNAICKLCGKQIEGIPSTLGRNLMHGDCSSLDVRALPVSDIATFLGYMERIKTMGHKLPVMYQYEHIAFDRILRTFLAIVKQTAEGSTNASEKAPVEKA
jgi:hypothetical protein